MQVAEGDPVRVNYSSLDALRKGFRDFHEKAEKGSDSKAMPQERRNPGDTKQNVAEGRQASSATGEAPTLDDEVWDIFESEKAEDPIFAMLLHDLKDMDASELLQECRQVAHQLRRTRPVHYGSS